MGNNKIKLVVTDLDGTLLTSEDKISDINKKMLLKLREQGIASVIATGRPLSECMTYVDEIQAYPYIVSMNGAMTLNLDRGKILHQEFMLQKEARSIVKVLDGLSVFYEMYTPYGLMTPLQMKKRLVGSGLHRSYIESFGSQILYLNNIQMFTNRVHKFFVATTDNDIKPQIEEALADQNVLVLSSLGAFVEIIPKTCDKIMGVVAVCNDMGISLDEVMAIGDSQNDMALLKRAGIGIAMNNAPDAVKKCATHITATNDEDGVAKALNNILNIK
ncbi:Cof-type HAD-IIB family hydrolase [Eubacterium barkeri]|uniref:Cof subfamily of IIB subfamily of haloacid dehalogenase superfamily/HAD-superfamily hydrolase, subfamily IIB n=1 Tax=Eubacterium barkeri TaxID=1528 RepID=A0A1H3JKQ1_EUBBA|nr:Cof-type HAD-IIB family hydrolase [Eubacterium barkeri]SDY40105.1 hypothetical protein SAMN04488579_1314 [Eubacterium barkeri]